MDFTIFFSSFFFSFSSVLFLFHLHFLSFLELKEGQIEISLNQIFKLVNQYFFDLKMKKVFHSEVSIRFYYLFFNFIFYFAFINGVFEPFILLFLSEIFFLQISLFFVLCLFYYFCIKRRSNQPISLKEIFNTLNEVKVIKTECFMQVFFLHHRDNES